MKIEEVDISFLSRELRKRGWRIVPEEHLTRLAKVDDVVENAMRTGYWPAIKEEHING